MQQRLLLNKNGSILCLASLCYFQLHPNIKIPLFYGYVNGFLAPRLHDLLFFVDNVFDPHQAGDCTPLVFCELHSNITHGFNKIRD